MRNRNRIQLLLQHKGPSSVGHVAVLGAPALLTAEGWHFLQTQQQQIINQILL